MRGERKPYAEKLRDPRWIKKRDELKVLANHTCNSCGATDKTLHVHHPFYKKEVEPWEYENLVVLCEDCHKRMQYFCNSFNDLLSHLPIHTVSTLFSIVINAELRPGEELPEKIILDKLVTGGIRSIFIFAESLTARSNHGKIQWSFEEALTKTIIEIPLPSTVSREPFSL